MKIAYRKNPYRRAEVKFVKMETKLRIGVAIPRFQLP